MTKSELKKVNKGLCIRCGQSPCTNGTLQCDVCKAKAIVRQKDNYEKRKNIGVCLRCGEERSNNGTGLCDKCRTRQNTMYEIRKKEGLCVDCGKETPTNGTICDTCKENEYKRTKVLSDTRKNNGVCVDCGKGPAVAGIVCETCWFKNIAQKSTGKAKNWSILKKLLEEQGYRCVYTGCKLVVGGNASVDHIIPKTKGGDNAISNLQWVEVAVNYMKRDMTHDNFLDTIKLIHDRQLFDLTKDK